MTAVPPTPGASAPPPDVRNWAMAAHLSAFVMFLGVPSLLGPLVVWLVKRDNDPFTAEHAKEALNFNLSLFLYMVIAAIGATALVVVTLGLALLLLIPLALALFVAWVVLTVQAGIAASNGRPHRYPFTIRLVS